MSPDGRRILLYVLKRSGFESQAELLSATVEDGAEPGRKPAVSRQARHAHFARARSSAALSALALALTDAAVREFVFSTDFAWLRPFAADAQFKWRHLGELMLHASPTRCLRIFDDGAELLMSLASRAESLEDGEVLRMHSALMAMYVGLVLHGRSFARHWREVWEEAEETNALRLPALRSRLAALGCWSGIDEPILDALLDPAMTRVGMAEGYCFVRTDVLPDVYVRTAELLRGQDVDPTKCLIPGRPAATIRALLDYVGGCFRATHHLRTPGQLLHLLQGVENSYQHARALQREGLAGGEIDDSLAALRTLERVQLMEKRRFWALCEAMPDGPAKSRMIELWQRSYTTELDALRVSHVQAPSAMNRQQPS